MANEVMTLDMPVEFYRRFSKIEKRTVAQFVPVALSEASNQSETGI